MSQSAADKTEKATPQQIKKAREKGQVPRSKDLATAALFIGCALMLLASADWFARGTADLLRYNMSLTREDLIAPDVMVRHVGASLVAMINLLSPLFLLIAVLALVAGALPGGPLLSLKNAEFKGSRIDPIAGIKRMFSMKSLVELIKSILKVSLILGTLYFLLRGRLEGLLGLYRMPLDQAVAEGVSFLAFGILTLGVVLLFIALIDVPWQIYDHQKELKMTRQQVKDEHKQMEGKPEVKARIRQIQQKMARSRAETAIPKADVLLTNPQHYAIALKYEPDRADAPFVLAKGTDELALHMRQLARRHGVEIIEAPPLARAVYHSTQVDQMVPQALYVAIAQVLSYVLQLKAFRRGQQQRPEPLPSFHIPKHLRH
ncbi:flagellar biosynthesis protein FlhB [Ferrimonas balearica]|uniref:flagellar biosynthesis protein FlhB n=1 Tax=Ferrimonas balearica TaxID=44012 RepID=UPI001C946064|nr:flagellar biosynthesis protein FlhB [Ferrimonas balearica]MBY5980667.1 flagellar biosynthesis protein FlhB [Ferrimonas balearica]